MSSTRLTDEEKDKAVFALIGVAKDALDDRRAVAAGEEYEEMDVDEALAIAHLTIDRYDAGLASAILEVWRVTFLRGFKPPTYEQALLLLERCCEHPSFQIADDAYDDLECDGDCELCQQPRELIDDATFRQIIRTRYVNLATVNLIERVAPGFCERSGLCYVWGTNEENGERYTFGAVCLDSEESLTRAKIAARCLGLTDVGLHACPEELN